MAEIKRKYWDDVSDDGSINNDDRESLDLEPMVNVGLSFQEKKNIFFLFSLYFFHSVPLSFSWETMPVLLRQQLPLGEVGTFLTSQYPYSIKVLWSPIVESLFLPFMGRRKTWLVPCFMLAGVVQFWLGRRQDLLVNQIKDGEPMAMVLLLLVWTFLMFLLSNIRIALDAWALDMLSQSNVHWASSAVSIGEASGGLVSFNLFLGIAALGKHRNSKTKVEEASTEFFYKFWAIAFFVVAVGLVLFRREPSRGRTSSIKALKASYRIIWKILKLPQVWTLMVVHLTSMVGFQCNDAITVLELVKYNLTDGDIAGLATIAFPFEVIGGIYVSRRMERQHPLRVWRKLFPWRLLVAFVSQLAVLAVGKYKHSHYRFFIAVIPFCLTKFFETTMFIALVAFHAQVSDPRYGGIYLPLLATTLNMRYDWMSFFFTKTIGLIDGGEGITAKSKRLIDGYQIVNLTAVCIAIPIFIWYLKPATKRLQAVDPVAWRVSVDDEDDNDAHDASKRYMMVNLDESTSQRRRNSDDE